MSAFDDMLSALSAQYADAGTLVDPRTAHLVVDGNAVVSRRAIPGVEWRLVEQGDVLSAELVISGNIAQPVHTCIGFLAKHGAQRIRIGLRVEPRSSASVIAHCLFPNALAGSHAMDAAVELGPDSQLRYVERHYHGLEGGMQVRPHIAVRVGPRARYFSDFSLTKGRAGTLDIGQRVQVAEEAIAEVTARVAGHGSDAIRISDEMVLSGRGARGLLKTRVALADDARSEVIGVTRGEAEGARGHMDCLEMVRDRAKARAEPIIDVSHPLAKVTHEAAVGTVDQNQLETLMAHGLTPDEAIELVVTGMLR